MAIPENIIDQIQQRVDIVEVISGYVPLKKAGRSYKANCPFHHEKTPSFIVSQDKQIYHCFGCGAGGNVFSFVMKYENLQFPEAVEMLAQKAGVSFARDRSRSVASDSFANQLYSINESAAAYFQTCLANNAHAKEYLSSRGVGDETIKRFKIGFAPDSWESCLNFFEKKGIKSSILEKAGLAIANDKGGHYDRFRNRIVFPILDIKNRILGFGARVLDSSLPKYINSPETMIYSKGKNLYGFNFSKEYIKKSGHALIVEGYLDFIIPYQAGVQNIIATLGTALTLDQVKLLKRFTGTVIMVYDPDEAGESASLRNLDIFLTEDVNVYIAELPSGYDPDTFIRKFGADDFTKLVKSSKNLFDYKLDKLNLRFDIRVTHGKAAIAGEMLPTISRINNAILRADLIKKLAEKLSVDEESLKVELRKVKPEHSEYRFTISTSEPRRDSKAAEIMVLALLLEGGQFVERVIHQLSPEEFKDTSVREVVNAIFAMHKENKEATPAKVINYFGENSQEAAILISEAASVLEMLTDKDRALEDCIARIKRDNVKDQLNRLQDAIRLAHNQKDEPLVKRLVTEYNDLVKTDRS